MTELKCACSCGGIIKGRGNTLPGHHMRGKKLTEEHKRNIGLGNIGRKFSVETREKISFSNKGDKNGSFGKPHKKELCESHSLLMKKMWQEPNYRDNMLEIRNTPEYKEIRRKIMKELWSDPSWAYKTISSQERVFNKCEINLNEILQLAFLNEYKYNGLGELTIEGKCPDFININGQKKIIELFGDYWHCNPNIYTPDYFNVRIGKMAKEVWQNDADRIKLFKTYGYETLVIWESELRDIGKIKNKLIYFNGGR